MLNHRTITITVDNGAEVICEPGSPEWQEALALLQGYYDDNELEKLQSITAIPVHRGE